MKEPINEEVETGILRRIILALHRRALFSSIERISALLIEQYKGDFPIWFAPMQCSPVIRFRLHDECLHTV
jgi:hypothetical protein